MNRRNFFKIVAGAAAAAIVPAWAFPKPEPHPKEFALEFWAKAVPRINFAALSPEHKQLWAKSLWDPATRESSLLSMFETEHSGACVWSHYAITRTPDQVCLFRDGEPLA